MFTKSGAGSFLILRFLFCWGMAAIPGAQCAIEIKEGAYHGWKQAFFISNGLVEAVIVPKVGRIMQLRFAGEEDGPFWEHRELDGAEPDSKSSEWKNFGGDKSWPSPQADWAKISGKAWPPPSGFDAQPVNVRIQGEALELESPVDPHFGISTIRTVTLNPTRPEMRVVTKYKKVEGAPVRAGIWVITQLREPERIFMPLPAQSIFPKGFNEQSPELPAELRVEAGVVTCARSSTRSAKIGSDASTLIWGNAKWLLGIRAARESSGEFPDHGSSAEIYTNPDPLKYVELEMLGPVRELKPGDSIRREQAYILARRTKARLWEDVSKVFAQDFSPLTGK